MPRGLAVVLVYRPNKAAASYQTAIDNQFIRGLAVQINWGDLEPVQGQPDWSKLDQIMAAAEASKKWVQLLVFPGFFSPKWALEGAQTETFTIQYGPGKGTMLPLPMPWDKVYLEHWFGFLKLLSDRYGKSPAFRVVAAAGPTSVSVEFTLPQGPEAVKKWQSLGYTPSKYLGAWQSVFETYSSAFPNQCVSLSEGGGLNIDDNGKIDHQQHLRTRQAMVDKGMAALGHRFVLQMSDVHAGPGPHVANSETEDAFVIGYNGRIITGFQMRTSAEHGGAVMGDEGDPPAGLRKSVDYAMEPNSAGKRVNYLEIYEPDVLAPEMQPVLEYAAGLFPK